MFKVPQTIAQDVLLIHELISNPDSGNTSVIREQSMHDDESDSIASSNPSSSSGSDKEKSAVVEGILLQPETRVIASSTGSGPHSASSPLDSSYEDSDSESNSSSEDEAESIDPDILLKTSQGALDDFEEDEEDGGKTAAGTVPRTKNELPEPVITAPDIEEVGTHEILERVGEIMNVINNIVIIKGLSSEVDNRGAGRALDSESLLVFEDRKVLGCVHETFGPTHQPLYQVRYPPGTSIDTEFIKISKPVFHIPQKSKYVFPTLLKAIKGSDASNIHDEEVPEDEQEFSDDEAEATFKRKRRGRREGRESSVATSRVSTPIPSQMHDYELIDDNSYKPASYDEFGPYDMYDVGPSRPAPLPYDDPYQDIPTSGSEFPASSASREAGESDRRRDIHRGRGHFHGRGRGRGRGGRSGRGNRGRQGAPYSYSDSAEHWGRSGAFSRENSSQQQESSLNSPTSYAASQVTGQYEGGVGTSSFSNDYLYSQRDWQRQQSYAGQSQHSQSRAVQAYSHHQSQQWPYVQPHINPRFASMFGIDINYMQAQHLPYSPFEPGAVAGSPYGFQQQNAAWTGWSQSALSDEAAQPEASIVSGFAAQPQSETETNQP